MNQRLARVSILLFVSPVSPYVIALKSWPHMRSLTLTKAAIYVRAYAIIALVLIPIVQIQGILDEQASKQTSEIWKTFVIVFGTLIVGKAFEISKLIDLSLISESLLTHAAKDLGCHDKLTDLSTLRLRNNTRAWKSSFADVRQFLASQGERRTEIHTRNTAQLLAPFLCIPVVLVIAFYTLAFFSRNLLHEGSHLTYPEISIVSLVFSIGYGFSVGYLLAFPLANWLARPLASEVYDEQQVSQS